MPAPEQVPSNSSEWSPRRRMAAALDFAQPDRIPVVYHPSTAGLYVHGQKLLELFRAYPPDNLITFDTLPAPPPETIDSQGRYHQFVRDAWGVTCEHLIFGIAGHPRIYPFPSWEAGRAYRFPPLPSADPAAFTRLKAETTAQRRTYLAQSGGISIFERLHALRPMDEVLMDLATADSHALAFLDRLVDYWQAVIADLLELDVDSVMFGDDWGTQTAPLVSPALFRRLFVPRYAALFEPLRRAGKRIFFHSCGYLGPIFDMLLDLGIDGLWPQIGLFEQIPDVVRRCRDARITVYIHPDRQRLIPLGTPAQIEATIRAYAERHHELGGGGIFYVEIENDAPWENVRTLIKAIDKYR